MNRKKGTTEFQNNAPGSFKFKYKHDTFIELCFFFLNWLQKQ